MRLEAMAFACVLCGASISPACAGAWTQAKGDTLLITTIRIARADEAFDAYGLRNDADHFSKKEVEAYLEYGLRNSLTLVLAPSFQKVKDGDREDTGLAYTDLGLRVRLYQGRYGTVSIQPLLILPGTTGGSDNPLLGSGRLEEEMCFSIGRDFKFLGFTGFQDVSGAYRYRGKTARNCAPILRSASI